MASTLATARICTLPQRSNRVNATAVATVQAERSRDALAWRPGWLPFATHDANA
jgi:hypothetical protein